MAIDAAVVLDPRLAEIWQLVWASPWSDGPEPDGVPLCVLGGLLRLAYLRGYSDAAEEEVFGSLFDELGLAAPRPVSSRKASAHRRGSGRARPGNSGR